ncbi:MAG: HAMP domain-containing sensor histidine kinase [Bacteroidota bacterium]
MKNAQIRILVVLAITTLVLLVSTQLYWLNRAIEQQDQVFHHNVHIALRNVVESLCHANGIGYPSIDPIEKVASNYYLVKTSHQVEPANLGYLIEAEIKKRSITQDFEFGIYDCQNDQMVFAQNLSTVSQRVQNSLPILTNAEYYFGVYFPNKPLALTASMDFWKFTTVFTILLIIFLGYAFFVILRQKRLGEIQRDFVNNVTHELKTPLATLSLASESLNQKAEEPLAKYVRVIRSEVGRLKVNVDHILNAAVADRPQKQTIERTDISILLVELVSEYTIQAKAQGLKWELTSNSHCIIKTDRSVVDQAIRNLFENAVKYGAKHIHVHYQKRDHETEISVSDDGIGIPKAHQKKIFRKFYRVPDREDQHNAKGFGLGLYIVKTSLKKIGGNIRLVSSAPGKGATFQLSVPNE